MADSLFPKHEASVLSLRLPMPPSLNHYRAIFQPTPASGKQFNRTAHRARLITSADGRAYLAHVKRVCAHIFDPLTGRLQVSVTICYRDRRKIDLDNRLKALLDGLKEAKVFEDDSQIDVLHVKRGPVSPPDGHVIVTLAVIGDE